MEETIQNLTKAFIGESQARNRYTIYAGIAKKEGYPQISEIFLETAEHERQHAKWLFRLINQLKEDSDEDWEEIEVDASAPTVYGDTKENLKAAIEGEHHENTEMYPDFAEIAEVEGYEDIAERLRSIAKAESYHESRYRTLLKEIENDTFFDKEEKIYWVCQKCGYIHEGEEPIEECPSCSHPAEYFKPRDENYF